MEGNGGGGPDQQAVAPVNFLRGDVDRRVACFLPPSFTRNQLMPPLYASHRRGWTRQTCLVSVLELMEGAAVQITGLGFIAYLCRYWRAYLRQRIYFEEAPDDDHAY